MKKIILLLIIPLFLLLTSSTNNHSHDEELFSYVNKIVRLIEWNEPDNSNFFYVGYYGDQKLYKLSEHHFAGKAYHDKPIRVINYHSLEEIEENPPKILYIGKHKHQGADDLINICSKNHIFSISDDQKALESDPLILLHVDKKHVNMIINKTEADKQAFKLSYHLLRVASEVK